MSFPELSVDISPLQQHPTFAFYNCSFNNINVSNVSGSMSVSSGLNSGQIAITKSVIFASSSAFGLVETTGAHTLTINVLNSSIVLSGYLFPGSLNNVGVNSDNVNATMFIVTTIKVGTADAITCTNNIPSALSNAFITLGLSISPMSTDSMLDTAQSNQSIALLTPLQAAADAQAAAQAAADAEAAAAITSYLTSIADPGYAKLVTDNVGLLPGSPVTINLTGLSQTNYLTTALSLPVDDAKGTAILRVLTTPSEMVTGFSANGLSFSPAFLRVALARNAQIAKDNIVGTPTTAEGGVVASGTASFATGCIMANGDNMVEYLVKTEASLALFGSVFYSSAYMVADPLSIKTLSDQIVTYGTNALIDTSVATNVVSAWKQILTNIGRTGGVGAAASFVNGDIYEINVTTISLGKSARNSLKLSGNLIGSTSSDFAPIVCTIQICVVAEGTLPAAMTLRSVPIDNVNKLPVYTVLNYSNTAPVAVWAATSTYVNNNNATTVDRKFGPATNIP